MTSSASRSSFTLHDLEHEDRTPHLASPVPRHSIHDTEDDIHFNPRRESLSPPPKPGTPLSEEITWDGPDDPENPKNWSVGRKWLITFIGVLSTVNVTFASSAPSSATIPIREELHISAEVSYLITSVFLVGYVFGPLVWGPGSELVGRRPIFIITMSFYTIFHLGQALAQNIETLLITRLLDGFFAVGPLVNAGGLIADIWDADVRGTATSLFSASVFLGPVLGPIVAGFMVESGVDWRWVFWVMMIFAGTCTLIVIVALPETYAPVLLLKKLKAKRKADPASVSHLFASHETNDWSVKATIDRTLFRPFKMLAGEPILVLVTLYLSLIYGVLYCLFETIPIIFAEKRGFTLSQTGLIFIGIGIGTSFGAFLNDRLSRHFPQLIKTWRGFPPPEERLLAGMVGGCSFPIAIFWLGWTGQYPSVPWYVPGLSTILVGMSISSIFISFISYMIDTYLMHTATALAANTFVRSLVAAAFPLFTVQMFHKLGVNYAATLLGGIGILLAPSPFLFYRYGPQIRSRSKYAPCKDLEIAEEIARERADAEKAQV
ncbi:MFS general substrate transporter [Favolaschia claudopus]|uniref:MFS general substrate transporter n=1 Tax=Favolaschia claudopus TaxID=2862362 RepID=A0AAW0DNI9_9AGAR